MQGGYRYMMNLVEVKFPGLGIDVNVNPVAFSIGSIEVYWYGLLIASAIVLAVILAVKQAKDFKFPEGLVYDTILVIIPCAIIWKGARMEYRHFVWPKEMARKEAKKQKDKELRAAMMQQYLDTAQVKDTTAAIAHMKVVAKKKARAKYQRDRKKIWNNNTGKPIAKGEFSRWTDISTSRWQTAVENLFGEGLIFHKDYLLKDVLRNRPVIVHYQWWSNYVVEGFIVLFFLLGILCGLRKRFFWMAFSFFLYDMALHMGLGFGINEIYIMTAHWAFVIPIAIAYLIKSINWRYLPYLRCLLFIITVYLFIHNTWLLCEYML